MTTKKFIETLMDRIIDRCIDFFSLRDPSESAGMGSMQALDVFLISEEDAMNGTGQVLAPDSRLLIVV